eukprot:490549_1
MEVGVATGRALESVTGKIMHWCQLRKPAKTVCYNLIHFIYEYIRTNKHLRTQSFVIPNEIKFDFCFWIHYAATMKVVSMESIIAQPSITMTASTDASDKMGGILFCGSWTKYKFVDSENVNGINHRQMDIMFKEAHAVIMMLNHYKKQLTGKNPWFILTTP